MTTGLAESVRSRLGGAGQVLRTGPFLVRLRTTLPDVVEGVALLYADNLMDETPFADFHVELARPRNPRRWFRPQVYFLHDGTRPFRPLPADQALAMLEWGLNWCIATEANSHLVLHAAVVERGGRAVLMPGPAGTGKSTLCAALALSGWRLLSDELALLTVDGDVVPLARPISLKNASIDVIGARFPQARFSKAMADTAKGRVALLKAPADSVARDGEAARPVAIVLPSYRAGASTRLIPASKAATCLDLGNHAFNYSVHGACGFDLITGLLDSSGCWRLTYSDLDEAMEAIAGLARA